MGSRPSAAHTTPWPRPRQSRVLWPEARSSEGAVPWSRPCRTGTAAPELKRSDDPPHAPWFASATHGASPYPQPQPSGIPADPFSRSPYHKVPGVEEAIRAVGASVLYLPSYSPDLNPIEQLLAKLKALLRKAAARTQDALWETIGTSLDAFTPAECQEYIVNSGYEFV